jgi:hypothetical protein
LISRISKPGDFDEDRRAHALISIEITDYSEIAYS